jgi:CRP/FNR family transcriptional regulator, cyclic AMP receptor protein
MATPAPRKADVAYDPAAALDFFKSAGKPETFGEGAKIFAESEKAIPLLRKSKMYLLLKGEVELRAKKKTIGSVKPGEIFGEIAVMAHAPRTAGATAKTECRVIALEPEDFEKALGEKPAFALMLMSMLIRRLRETIAQLSVSGALAHIADFEEAIVFDKKQLQQLVVGLADDPPVFFQQGATIIAKGQTGIRMYAVIEGEVAVSIDGRIVEILGPGGVFGEAALVTESARLASATANSDCELLAIGRPAFLQLIKVSPDFAATLLSSLAARLRFLTNHLNPG